MGKTLIITAGGVKGFLALGGVFALKVNDEYKDFVNFCGVSVGSILATLLAMNLDYSELLTESLEFDFFDSFSKLFSNFNVLELIGKMRRKNIKGLGILDPSKIQERIEYWMIIKYRKKLTFADLYNYTGNTLTIVVTDRSSIDEPKPIYLNWKTTPTYSISRAVVESCSIPGVFELENPNRIDGVFSDPFPYEVAGSEPAIAFILQEELRAPEESSLAEALLNVYSATLIPIKLILKEKIVKCPENVEIIQLRRVVKGIELPIPFKMSRDDKIQMIVAGFQQASEQLRGRSS